jgi:prepilin-type processing-associated H-X9-DG protein
MKALAVAWINFAADHDGATPDGDPEAGGWAYYGNGTTQYSAGVLYPYLLDPNVYNCPDASNEGNTRSYSVNEVFANSAWYWQPVWYRKMRQVKNPSQTYIFIEEFDPRGYNEGGFVIPRYGWSWVDIPAHRHGGRMGGTWDSQGNTCNLSYADGHAEGWKFNDPRTLAINNFYASTPNDLDLSGLQGVLGW